MTASDVPSSAPQAPSGALAQTDGGLRIDFRGLTKEFRPHKRSPVLALDHIDLTITGKQVVTIVGPSGCGKTTLLRILAGLENATSGSAEITTDDRVRPISSTVFQEGSVFPWLTVRHNVEYSLKLRGVPRRERRAIAQELIDKVGLGNFSNAYPSSLSGGMRQRVSVARAFANGPQILLMDEPFASVDEQTRTVLQEELLRLWSEFERTVVLVTHSIDEAIILSDRIIVMSPRPGRIIADIPVTIPRPRRVVELRKHPTYGDLYTRIWSLLRPSTPSEVSS
jgi:NitT/TauT family transport system ATP-binding protein